MEHREIGHATTKRKGCLKLSDVIPEVIRLADRIRTDWDTELPKRHVHDPIVDPGGGIGTAPA